MMETKKVSDVALTFSGEAGIRTLGPASWSTVFETAPIDHSGISPCFFRKSGCKITTFF